MHRWTSARAARLPSFDAEVLHSDFSILEESELAFRKVALEFINHFVIDIHGDRVGSPVQSNSIERTFLYWLRGTIFLFTHHFDGQVRVMQLVLHVTLRIDIVRGPDEPRSHHTGQRRIKGNYDWPGTR